MVNYSQIEWSEPQSLPFVMNLLKKIAEKSPVADVLAQYPRECPQTLIPRFPDGRRTGPDGYSWEIQGSRLMLLCLPRDCLYGTCFLLMPVPATPHAKTTSPFVSRILYIKASAPQTVSRGAARNVMTKQSPLSDDLEIALLSFKGNSQFSPASGHFSSIQRCSLYYRSNYSIAVTPGSQGKDSGRDE